MSTCFDARLCDLGEGPLWHPLREELFWFDITASRLLSRKGAQTREWLFQENVSAAGWIDADTLLIASETALFSFEPDTGLRRDVAPLEADDPRTRSNDGRTDPKGGFWIGTMGKAAEPGLGAIYRYYQGALTQLYGRITIPNAICFSPDGRFAYFTDTLTRRILRQTLDDDGWPEGQPGVFADLSEARQNPDGAVVDAEGGLWVALWGAGRVLHLAPDGSPAGPALAVPATQPSCPAFGGPDLSTLFVTSARQDLARPGPQDGQLFQAPAPVRGQAEHRVEIV